MTASKPWGHSYWVALSHFPMSTPRVPGAVRAIPVCLSVRTSACDAPTRVGARGRTNGRTIQAFAGRPRATGARWGRGPMSDLGFGSLKRAAWLSGARGVLAVPARLGAVRPVVQAARARARASARVGPRSHRGRGRGQVPRGRTRGVHQVPACPCCPGIAALLSHRFRIDPALLPP